MIRNYLTKKFGKREGKHIVVIPSAPVTEERRKEIEDANDRWLNRGKEDR